jgi:hypothetical protein
LLIRPPRRRLVRGTPANNVRGVELARFPDGKVVENHLYFDNMEILTQLGLVPEATTA